MDSRYKTSPDRAQRVLSSSASDPRGETEAGLVDPAPKPVLLVSERAERFVADISNATLDELRQLRDQIDEAMRAIQKRRDGCLDTIMAFAEDTNAAVEMKNVVSDAMVRLQDRLKDGEKVPPTITRPHSG